MGTIDRVPLRFEDQQIAAGAAYWLSNVAPLSFDWMSVSGNRCILNGGSRWLIVEANNPAGSLAELLQNTYEDAQRALDLLAMHSRDFLTVPSPEKKHLLWYRTGGRIVVRLTDSVAQTIRVESSVVVTRADGTVEYPLVQPLPAWQEAMRYVRYSQTRNDLYVAYRDAFLALESVLSAVSPQVDGERETDWLVRAVRALEIRGIDFTNVVAPGGADNVRSFVAEQFRANRCALFHAKSTKPHIVPGTLVGRRTVAVALERLEGFLFQAMRIVFGAGASIPVLTLGGIRRIIDGFANELTLAVSPDATPATEGDLKVSPAAQKNGCSFQSLWNFLKSLFLHDPVPSLSEARSIGDMVTDLRTTFEGVSDGFGYEFGFLGSVAVSDMESRIINTIASYTADGLSTRGDIEQLDLDGADDFELRMIWSYRQRARLQTDFEL